MKRKYGFTLIEILTVVIIIGILASLSIPPFIKTVEVSRGRIARTNLKLIYSAEKIYRNENDTYYPSPAGEVTSLTEINKELGLDLSTNEEAPSQYFEYSVRTTDPQKDFLATAVRKDGRYRGWKITIDQKEEISEEDRP